MKQIIQQLELIIADYTPQLRQCDPENLSFKPQQDKWSGKEMLGHLIDSAQSNIRRFVMAQYEDRPHIVYAQDKWVAAANYSDYPLNDLIDLWVLLNKHMVIILKNLPEGAAAREVQTEELHTIEWLAEDYNKHLLHHLHQVLDLEQVPYS
jgi:hypothetical protein